MKIALLGGRFDPPHLGHLHIAEYVLCSKLGIQEVWLIPANTHPWRQITGSSNDRLEMTKLLVQSLKKNKGKIKVMDTDIKRGGDTYTIETVGDLFLNKKNDYFWIFGSDQIKDFKNWKNYKKLQELIKFVVIPRKGYESVDLPENFILLSDHYHPTNLSSSEIRYRIKEGLSISKLVPKSIEKYIKDKKLYAKN